MYFFGAPHWKGLFLNELIHKIFLLNIGKGLLFKFGFQNYETTQVFLCKTVKTLSAPVTGLGSICFVHKRNASGRCFFYALKTFVFIDSK